MIVTLFLFLLVNIFLITIVLLDNDIKQAFVITPRYTPGKQTNAFETIDDTFFFSLLRFVSTKQNNISIIFCFFQ